VNLILIEPGEPVDGEVVLGGRRARHLVEVLRAAPGDRLRAGIVGGARGTAEVIAAAGAEVRLRLALDQPPSPPPSVDLVLAVPRPKALSRILETAAALGVGRIDLVNAWRVDKSYLSSRRLAAAALRADLLLGCEQGGTTWLPAIAVHPLLMPFLGDQLPARLSGRRGLIAHPGAAPVEAALPPGAATPLVVAVGPEGGWIQRELDSFAGLGFAAVAIAGPVLRSDAAVAALLAQIDLLRRLPG